MKILIIGCGSIGLRYIQILTNKNSLFIFDKNKQLSKGISKKYNCNLINRFNDLYKFNFDLTIICTPPNVHIQIAKKITSFSKNILIEKPVSNNYLEAKNFYLKNKKKNIFVMNNFRFHPAIKVIKKNLNKLGKIFFVRSHFGNYLPNMRSANYQNMYMSKKRLGGGVLLDSIHELDYLLFLFGPIKSVLSNIIKASNLKIDTEDLVEAIIKHKNGICTNLHLDYLRFYKLRGCEIVGENGMLNWQSEGKNPEKCSVWIKFNNNKNKISLLKKTIDVNKTYQDYFKLFLNFIKNKKKLKINNNFLKIDNAIRQIKIIDDIFLSSKKNKEIKINLK